MTDHVQVLATAWERLPAPGLRTILVSHVHRALRMGLTITAALLWGTVLDLIEAGEMTQAEAAKLMGVSRQAIHQRLKKRHPEEEPAPTTTTDEDDDLDPVLMVSPPPGMAWDAVITTLRSRRVRAQVVEALTGPLPIPPPGQN